MPALRLRRCRGRRGGCEPGHTPQRAGALPLGLWNSKQGPKRSEWGDWLASRSLPHIRATAAPHPGVLGSPSCLAASLACGQVLPPLGRAKEKLGRGCHRCQWQPDLRAGRWPQLAGPVRPPPGRRMPMHADQPSAMQGPLVCTRVSQGEASGRGRAPSHACIHARGAWGAQRGRSPRARAVPQRAVRSAGFTASLGGCCVSAPMANRCCQRPHCARDRGCGARR
jgi:hypothetical protein